MPASAPRITDLSQLPLVLTIDEMATLYRRAKSTIRRRIQQGRFRPAPYDGPPYRWLRAHIERDLQQRGAAPRRPRPSP
jgi:IS30 family transposase